VRAKGTGENLLKWRRQNFECGAFNHSATSPEPETGLKRPRMDGRYVTKHAKTDKGRAAYIAPSSINPAMAPSWRCLTR